MNSETTSIELKEYEFDALQALYAEMHELRVRMEQAQEKAAIAARCCVSTAGMILRGYGYDPDNFGNINLEKKGGKLLLHLTPAVRD